METLVRTAPVGLSGNHLGSVLATVSSLGRVGSAHCTSSLDAGPSLRPALHIGGLRLGFSQCPCSSTNSSRIGRSVRRLIKKKTTPNSWSHISRQTLEFRAQLPAHDEEDEESKSSKGSQTSFNGKIASSVDSPAVGEPGKNGKQRRIPYGLITCLASVGFLETAYLTWAKLGGTTVTCPIEGSCTEVLDSSYATVFGIPLAFLGMVAYGAVGLLGGIGLWSRSRSSDWEEEGSWVRWLLLGSTTSMGAASICFMYILLTKLEGASCAYCVSSAVLSLSLLLSTLRGFTLKDARAMAGLQLGVGASVVLGLSVAFADSATGFSGSQDLDLPPVEPEVLTVSSAQEISLAKHLQSVGARMYGAFWCSHCYEQKQMFGREAMKYVDYVECYPEGYRKGVKIAEACDVAKVQGFPTWIIKGQTISGEVELEDLAKVSGFDPTNLK